MEILVCPFLFFFVASQCSCLERFQDLHRTIASELREASRKPGGGTLLKDRPTGVQPETEMAQKLKSGACPSHATQIWISPR